MEWPSEITEAFKKGMHPLKPKKGHSVDEVIQFVLDETAACAVYRAQGDPEALAATINMPFTPLGSVVPGALYGRELTEGYTLNEHWSPAVESLYLYVRSNAESICREFAGKGSPWEWDESLEEEAEG